TTISFALGNPEHVNLAVYDISGRLVRTLVDNKMDAGEQNVIWNGKDSNGQHVASGVYFYKMIAGDFSSTDKMILLK
ncbi:MAG: T9SS type A sorting domain-containing protein, partial [Proteobacteria bacterium]|nr:T9SS type A sorting domain-containing protein [Pseudomonadota bacterium]